MEERHPSVGQYSPCSTVGKAGDEGMVAVEMDVAAGAEAQPVRTRRSIQEHIAGISKRWIRLIFVIVKSLSWNIFIKIRSQRCVLFSSCKEDL
jgi:hypothetical protein